jgi:hypothetical protein
VCVSILALVISHANPIFTAPHGIVTCRMVGSIIIPLNENFLKKEEEKKRLLNINYVF